MTHGMRKIRYGDSTEGRFVAAAFGLSCQPGRVVVDSAGVVVAVVEEAEAALPEEREAVERLIRTIDATSAVEGDITPGTAPGPEGAKDAGGLAAVALVRVHVSFALVRRLTAAAVAVIATASAIVTVVPGPRRQKSPAEMIAL